MTTRMLYECVGCGHLYMTKNVSCDCAQNDQFEYREWCAERIDADRAQSAQADHLPEAGNMIGVQAVAEPAVEPVAADDFQHEQMDALALARYKVVPSDQSMFWRYAVAAGDGQQHLYNGSEVDCQNMARKFAGAFLDGAFVYQTRYAAHNATKAEPAPIPKYQTPHDFKNFHRQLCARFGYVHDEQFWWRDLVSLIEHIASKAQPAVEPVAVPHKQITEEIDLILSDPDLQLTGGAERSLRWIRTWVSVPLFIGTAPTTKAGAPAAVEPVASEVIAGALFDFLGYLTTLPKQEAVTLSCAHNAAPAVEQLEKWAAKRSLSLDGADVSGWRTPNAEPAPALKQIYVSARECVNCDHIGINDESSTHACCSACQWGGESPHEDKCPECQKIGTMTAACPKCESEYRLLAEACAKAEPADAPEPPVVKAPAAVEPVAANFTLAQETHIIDLAVQVGLGERLSPILGDGAPVFAVNKIYRTSELLDFAAALLAPYQRALATARDHIDMEALQISHCKDAAAIDAAMTAQQDGGV